MIHSDSNSLHFSQIATLLRRRWLLVTVFVLMGLGLTLAAAVLLEPKYTAKAQILFEAQMQDGVAVIDEAAVNTLVEMLISPNHIRRLAVSLEEDPGEVIGQVDAAEPEVPDTEAPAAGELAVPSFLRPVAENETVERLIAAVNAPPEVPVLTYEALKRGLNAYKERQSRLIAVTFSTTDPETAAIVANRAVDLHLQLEAEFQRDRRASYIKAVSERIPKARRDLDRAEAALRVHQVRYGLSDESVTDATAQQISELNRQLSKARSDLEGLVTQLDRRQAASRSAPGRDTVIDNTAPSAGDAAQRRLCGSGGACPQQGVAQVLERMTLDRIATEARIDDIERRLATLQRASVDKSDAWTRLRELQHEAESAGKTYDSLLRRHADLLARNDQQTPVRLITTASVPVAPSTPNPLLFAVPAVVVSLIIGGMIAALFERLDQRFRGERDVEETLGVPCIGLVPKISRRRFWSLLRLLREQPFARYTEAIRGVYLATSRVSANGTRPVTQLITSCAKGEGKTTIAVSLALYAAQLQRRVLLIDLDFRNPGVTRLLGPDQLVPSLSGIIPPWGSGGDDGIQTALRSGVDVISLPRAKVDPLSVLASDDFAAFLTEMKSTYDYILLDGGTVEDATETQLLASMVDRVVLTVRWGVTDARAGLAAMNRIRGMSPEASLPVGVIINQVRMRVHARRRYSEPSRASATPQVQGS
ncbi:uncharacterized protein involved in exopolysaccharide biosynthesis [Aliiruegeria haliotis]|uniref:Uncharacterized protein involved in exopolysaccharide biosynthesis n=1 Tax=Aliiruegeria haliotis TaxID=1280846 RepID=A0A2T0RVH0_9RHOB|nr:Wzz/FepE/Etk N-terminal domain-containing protein [Aliiruegeria haliotis]PRY25196.1 uncharacterized protein involved in exopolysaccharide biosynthesis [Aliiruegeria haliotis]